VRGEETCAYRPITDPKDCGDLSAALALLLQLQNPFANHLTFGTAQLLAIRSRIPNPGTHPLPNQIAIKLRHRTYNCEERLAATVYPFRCIWPEACTHSARGYAGRNTCG
jgi:hypothetical protein